MASGRLSEDKTVARGDVEFEEEREGMNELVLLS